MFDITFIHIHWIDIYKDTTKEYSTEFTSESLDFLVDQQQEVEYISGRACWLEYTNRKVQGVEQI